MPECFSCVSIQGLDDPKLIFQALPLSLAGRTFELASNAERVPGDASLKRLKLGTSFVSGEDSPARSLIIAARANSRRLTCEPLRPSSYLNIFAPFLFVEVFRTLPLTSTSLHRFSYLEVFCTIPRTSRFLQCSSYFGFFAMILLP